MKKRLLTALVAVVFTVVTCLTLTGCAIFNIFKKGVDFDESCYVNNDDVKFSYSQEEYDDFLETIDKLTEGASTESLSEAQLAILLLDLGISKMRLEDAYALAELYYNIDMSNEEAEARYFDMTEKYASMSVVYNAMFEPLAKSSYREMFFEGMTDEEIDLLLAMAVTDPQLVTLETNITQLTAQYHELSEDEILGNKFNELYTDVIDTNNQIAKIYGFENYIDYSYTMLFNRDFDTEDTKLFSRITSQSSPAIFKNASKELDRLTDSLAPARINEIDAILNAPFTAESSKTILKGFYKSLGDDVYAAYQHVMSDGYYYIASSPNAYQGAYTSYYQLKGEPFMYFSSYGNQYTTVGTFVHEFGHYLNAYLGDWIPDLSYELAETHSQGAEWLFNAYVSNLLSGKDEYSYFVNKALYEHASMIIWSSLVGTVEIDAYNHSLENDINTSAIFAKVENELYGPGTIEELFPGFMMPSDYYRFVAIDAPGYYISYAVSLTSSLELYAMATEDYTAAVSAYTSLLSTEETYLAALEAAGLSSPFTAQAFDNILRALNGGSQDGGVVV